jgi:hypothetical protein
VEETKRQRTGGAQKSRARTGACRAAAVVVAAPVDDLEGVMHRHCHQHQARASARPRLAAFEEEKSGRGRRDLSQLLKDRGPIRRHATGVCERRRQRPWVPRRRPSPSVLTVWFARRAGGSIGDDERRHRRTRAVRCSACACVNLSGFWPLPSRVLSTSFGRESGNFSREPKARPRTSPLRPESVGLDRRRYAGQLGRRIFLNFKEFICLHSSWSEKTCGGNVSADMIN